MFRTNLQHNITYTRHDRYKHLERSWCVCERNVIAQSAIYPSRHMREWIVCGLPLALES